jgi:hypothetical protein
MNTDYIFSVRSDVVQVRRARRRQEAAEGYRCYGSRHERTGLGDVDERRESLHGVWKSKNKPLVAGSSRQGVRN